MERELYKAYVNILHEELIPAMGCTEPIAIAYAAALAKETLGCQPEKVAVTVSGNIIKNVKSVIVPHTGKLRGIEAAAAAGIVAGKSANMLEVISEVTPEQIEEISAYLENTQITVKDAETDLVFSIEITVEAQGHQAYIWIADKHTNVVRIKKDDEILFDKPFEKKIEHKTDRKLLTVESIVEFADQVDIADIEDIIGRQVEYNSAIAAEGLKNNYGANIGKILLNSNVDTVSNRAKAWAAAGSDARMNGCEMPVVINSGSGNQGMTTSLPVIEYAKELGASKEQLFRALVISNLVAIHLKTGIGCLSAYCGATSAGCGAGAGICYLYGGRYKEISNTIVNTLAINSGMICDGAKASCAAKIASSVEAGILGLQMSQNGSQFESGDGIVTTDVEATINNVGKLARDGMRQTDKEIIQIMVGK